jgi:hypothetical protein
MIKTLLALLCLAHVLASVTILYASLPEYDGNRVSYAESTALCKQSQLGLIYTQLQCQSALSMLLFDGMSYASFAVNQSAPVKGPTDQIIASNWTYLVNGQLTQSLFAADVLPSTLSVWWSGANALGQAAQNCGDWTSNDTACIFGLVGGAAVTTNEWASLQFGSCNVLKSLMCVCIGGTPLSTHSPTEQPTASPTRLPTDSPSDAPSHSPTRDPSKSPSHEPSKSPSRSPTASPLIEGVAMLFGSSVVGSTDPAGAIGICTASLPGYGCELVLPIMCTMSYLPANFPKQYGFSPNMQVVDPSFAIIAPTWAGLFHSGPSASLQSHGVIGDNWWSGCNFTGNGVGADNCDNFNDGGGPGNPYWCNLGSPTNTGTEWLDGGILDGSGSYDCGSAGFPFLCACIGVITPEPTHSPTTSPTTSQPSKSPTPPTTFSPTTKSPTASPLIEQSPILYKMGNARYGNLLSFNNASLNCIYSNSLYTSLGCKRAIPFLSYNTSIPYFFPSLYGFDGTLPVLGSVSSMVIATSWTNLFTSVFVNPLSTATTLASNPWTGCVTRTLPLPETICAASPPTTSNCNGWTTTAGNGVSGLYTATDPGPAFENSNTQACSSLLEYLCVCLK